MSGEQQVCNDLEVVPIALAGCTMTLTIEKIPLDRLQLDPNNARRHGDRNMKAIKNSLRNFGQVEPLVVHRTSMVVVGGNGRLAAMRALGWNECDVVMVDLDEARMRALSIALNRTAELAEWDDSILGETLKWLGEQCVIDVGEIGFTSEEVEALLPPAMNDGLTDPDAVPDAAPTRCKPGDVWALGAHRLMCGDSTNVQHVERLMAGDKAGVVYTDPPYGLGKAIANDASDEWFDVLRGAYHAAQDVPVQFWWCAASGALFLQAMQLIEPARVLVWHKPFNLSPPTHGFAWHYEPCLYKPGQKPSENKSDVVSMNTIWRKADPENVGHPTQKPVALAEELLKGIEGPVLDLFLGSGSTLIACEKTGRRCFGMEIDPKYCDVVLSRWEQFTGKSAVLEVANGQT